MNLSVFVALLGDFQVICTLHGHLGEMGDAKNLFVGPEGFQLVAYDLGNSATNAYVDLIVNTTRHPVGLGSGDLNGQANTGQLTTRGDDPE